MIIKYKIKTLCGKFTLALSLISLISTAQDTAYKGTVGKTFAESKEYWIPPVTAPKGAPNVIWILLDDVGFGAHQHLVV